MPMLQHSQGVINMDEIFFDRRSLELKYQIPVGRISEFFRGLEKGKIMATKCKDCNEIFFPPQVNCPNCPGSEVEWVELDGDATLETFTVINVKPTSFSRYPDYVVAIGKMKEGVKVLSWLNIEDPKKIRIGMNIRLKVVKREEEYYTYEFFVE
ncbi:MAG: 3-hydroxybutyryl-CoA epimerase [Aciduliprofundum sp.]|nr:Zn-ribbon domain-containing OB-fold protein [Thermoplasmatales archaeon]PMP75207.1 MAG: 3-hydroxybutyryl-CoA epimerase [Aciduliprofundum sp.]